MEVFYSDHEVHVSESVDGWRWRSRPVFPKFDSFFVGHNDCETLTEREQTCYFPQHHLTMSKLCTILKSCSRLPIFGLYRAAHCYSEHTAALGAI